MRHHHVRGHKNGWSWKVWEASTLQVFGERGQGVADGNLHRERRPELISYCLKRTTGEGGSFQAQRPFILATDKCITDDTVDGQQSENRFPPVQLSDVCTKLLSCFQSEDRALGRASQTSSPQCTSLDLSFAQRLFGVLFIVAFHPPIFTARLNHRPAPLIAPFETGPFVPWLSTSDLNSFILDTGEHILEFSILSYLGSDQLLHWRSSFPQTCDGNLNDDFGAENMAAWSGGIFDLMHDQYSNSLECHSFLAMVSERIPR